MINDRFNVLGILSNPENCDILHIYAIVNFNPQGDALIRNQAVNHLNLYPVGLARGVVVLNKKESAVRIQDPIQQEYSISLKNTKIFCTNDEVKYLLEDKSVGFACSINAQWMPNKGIELYYLQTAEIDLSELFKLEYETAEENPINQSYYELTLVSFDDLINLNNTKINFQLIHYSPNIEKVNWIEYTIPNGAVYQTISVFGNLENKETGEEIKNVLLPLEFYKGSDYQKPQALPILALPDSLTAPAKLDIKSFNLNYQLPYVIAKHITTEGRSLKNAFDLLVGKAPLSDGKPLSQKDANNLYELIVKLFINNWLYTTNFEVWNAKKSNEEFIKFFNDNYANKTVFDKNSETINNFLIKNIDFKNSIIWDIFKALCLACSDFLPTPYMWSKGSNDNFKNVLWFYFVSSVEEEATILDENNFEGGDGFEIKRDIYTKDITVNFKSNFFEQAQDGKLQYKNNTLIDTNLNTITGEYVNIPKIPDTLNKIEEDWSPYSEQSPSEKTKYISFLFFNSDVENFVSKWLEYTTTNHYSEVQYVIKKDSPVVKEDFKRFFPDGMDLPNNFEMHEMPPEIVNVYRSCSEQYDQPSEGSKWYDPTSWLHQRGARHGENPPPSDTKQDYCWVWYEENDVAGALLNNHFTGLISFVKDTMYTKWLYTTWGHGKIKENREVKEKYKLYKAYGLVEFEIQQNVINNFYLQDETSLKVLLNPNNDPANQKMKIRLQLKDDWHKKGWIIKSITSDKHKSFFDSAIDVTINFDNWSINEKTQKKEIEKNINLYYILNYSFQKNSPVNCMTQNKY